MEKKLSDLNVVELKSLAYDELNRIEQSQANLRILNEEIYLRIQQFQQNQQTNLPSSVSAGGDISV
jgi:hypothetical protein